METTAFKDSITQGYACQGPTITLGTAMLNETAVLETPITVALKSFSRHGLIAGATGTGKTKTIQLIAELLSQQGVPSILMDLKGDLSGLAAEGISNAVIEERQKTIGIEFEPNKFPVEMLSLSEEPGVRLRATASEFGPALFSQILELNDTQTGVMAVIFKYCSDQNLPLVDLKDLTKVLQYLTGEGKKEIESQYGRISTSSTGSIQRKIIALQQQNADVFFGEPTFDVQDLLHTDTQGRGQISILRLTDIQDRPKLFSTFMLNLLSEVYGTFPEIGDAPKPKLVIFIDEAHLIFSNASKALLDKIESIIKLIRSKGVGIFFCTQSPTDIPNAVLGQLGMKVQHALRAFTAKDRKAIKLTAENYPISEYYKTDNLLTSMGIGEAAVTALDEKGRPTPLAATLLQAPRSRMGPLTMPELQAVVAESALVRKYDHAIDRESAHEILTKRLAERAEQPKPFEDETMPKSKHKAEGLFDKLAKNRMARQMGNTFIREITRALMSFLGIKKTSERRKRK